MTLLVSDKAYLPALLKLLDGAEASVDVLAFSFAIGSAGGRIAATGAPYRVAEKLAELAARGVRVRAYLEGRRETAERNVVTARYLRARGIEVRLGATHAKGFCVDGSRVLFGSTNLTNQSIRKNFETNLLLEDDRAVREFLRYFRFLWRGGRHGGIHLAPPFHADGDFKPELLDMIRSAKRSLEFSIYFFDQREIEAALADAHRRGVKITGLIHRHFAFALSYVRRTQATASRLVRAGVRGLHYGPHDLFTHSKYLIRDRGEVALGTGNWLDEDVEIHPQLYVRLRDPRLARQLAGKLGRQIRDAGEPFTAARAA